MLVECVGWADGQVDHTVGEGVLVFGFTNFKDAAGIGQRYVFTQDFFQVIVGSVQEA